MSRSKILSDMASQDVTAAEFDVLDGDTSNTLPTQVFPAGHILKTQVQTITEREHSINANSATDFPILDDATATIVFTPIQSTTGFIVHLNIITRHFPTWGGEVLRAYYQVGSGSLVQYGFSGAFRNLSGQTPSSSHNAIYNTFQVSPSGIAMGGDTTVTFKFTYEGHANGAQLRSNSYNIDDSSVDMSTGDIGDFGSNVIIQEVKV